MQNMYQNSTIGLKFQYPGSWHKEPDNIGTNNTSIKIDPVPPSDDFNLTISIANVSNQNLNLHELAEAELQNFGHTNSALIKDQIIMFGGLKPPEQNITQITTLAGYPAYR
jgi:hypothetical protein